MKTIAFFTTTRAEFGILKPLIQEVNNSASFKALVFVGGTHIKKEHGYTIEEIIQQNIQITYVFDYLLNENTPASLAKSLGIATLELSNIFSSFQFDIVCLLGDRFELLSIASVAILFRKPIIHIHGGEISEGAIDDQIRHMISKASHIHFATCDTYANNLRLMGEADWRIYNTGALSVDNMINNPKLPKHELFKSLGLKPDLDTIVLTYHPVTLEFKVSPVQQILNIFRALEHHRFQIVITSPNCDMDRNEVLQVIHQEITKTPNYHYIESLGTINYQNLVQYCNFIIGNSSSGVIEVPFFKIPSINIGDRQKGRIMHKSVINTDYSIDSIKEGIKTAISKEFSESIKVMDYKFGNRDIAKKMLGIISSIEINESLLRKKSEFPDNNLHN